MSVLSVIKEEAEDVSVSSRRASRLDLTSDAADPSSRNVEGQSGVSQTQQSYRISIFSSGTSYGEVLPQDQATLGFGTLIQPYYEKSLSSIPRGSVTAKTASVRSGVTPPSSNRGEQASRHSQSHFDALVDPRNQFPELEVPRELSPHLPKKFESPRNQPLEVESMEYDSTERPPSFPKSLLPAITEASAKESSERYSIKSKQPKSSTSSISSAPPDYKSKSSSNAQSDIKLAFVPLSPSKKSRSFSSSSSSSSTTTSSSLTSTVSGNSGQLTTSQASLRTLDDVVDEVATSLALRAKMQAESVTLKSSEVIKIGVCATMSRTNDQYFLSILASKIHHAMALQNSYLFALFPSMTSDSGAATLIFCGAPQRLVTKASILAGLRFKTRLVELQDLEGTWTGSLGAPPGSVTLGPLLQDEEVLWDIVRKAVSPVNPIDPPAGSRGAEQLVLDARARLDRLSPREAYNEACRDGILVDIRPDAQRHEYGSIPGAVIIERNDLEWRFDPRCMDDRLAIADRYDLRVIVYCQDGKSSSLAAASLQNIGIWRATDIEGGFLRWANEGLPTHRIPYDASSVAGESVNQDYR